MTQLIQQETEPADSQQSQDSPLHLIIAGPCSAETEEQVMQTAAGLSGAGISYMRAGIWKPRTSPDSFEGVGEIGLSWLRKAADTYNLKTTIEVATPRHVELALKYGVDMLWVGARTTVNPFAVQELADRLRGVDIPVMVKNPVNPDLSLWMGAVDRFSRVGVKQIIACHRGFNVHHKTGFRNPPLWDIPLDFKRIRPEIRLICDPSHITGKRELVAPISQKALDLGFEGLMIETHPDPVNAWSDARQQITPADFTILLSELVYKKKAFENDIYQTRLSGLRAEIDEVDEQLVALLAQRLEAARKIGGLKQANTVAFYQHNRWDNVLRNCIAAANQHGISKDFVEQVFRQIHLEALEIQGE